MYRSQYIFFISIIEVDLSAHSITTAACAQGANGKNFHEIGWSRQKTVTTLSHTVRRLVLYALRKSLKHKNVIVIVLLISFHSI